MNNNAFINEIPVDDALLAEDFLHPEDDESNTTDGSELLDVPARGDFFGDPDFERNIELLGGLYQRTADVDPDEQYLVSPIADEEEEFATFEDRAIRADNVVCGYSIYRNRVLLKMAEELRYIKNNRFYTCNYASWSEYLNAIGIGRHKANRIIKVIDILDALKKQGYKPDIGNVEEVRLTRFWIELVDYDPELKTVSDPDGAMEQLENAKVLSWPDFKILQSELVQKKTKPTVKTLINNGAITDQDESVIIGNYTLEHADNNKHKVSMTIRNDYIKGQGDKIPILLDATEIDGN